MRILSDHHVPHPDAFYPVLYKALVKAMPALRIRQSLLAENHTRAFILWEAPSAEAVRDFINGVFTDPQAREFSVFGGITGPLTPGPAITSVFPFSVIRPGGGVIVLGTNFRDTPGLFLLKGNFPGGQVNLTDLQWGDTFAGGVIPQVTGAPDQQASLQIVTFDGKSSNLWPVEFTATRQVVLLPGNVLTLIGCGSSGFGGIDNCLDFGPPHTIEGFHSSTVDSSADGQDVYQCELQNGWVFDHYAWGVQDGVNGGPFGPEPDPVGKSSFTIDVHWFFDVFSSAYYELSIFVVGPVGVPFH